MRLLLIFVSLFVFNPVFAKAVDCKDHSRYPDVSTAKLESLVAKKDVTIIDVNTESSFKEARVTGAQNYYANKDKMDSILPKDKNAMIITYCGGKSCTAWQKAAEKACEMGYTNVHHYSAGINGWKSRKK